VKPTNSHLARYGTTIFDTMSRLAREKQAINLGQGIPEDGVPADIVARAATALTEGSNQYPPMLGVPALRQALAAHDRAFYGIDLDWERETMVTSGGTEALASTLLALIEPGDEIVLVEPLYDSYLPIVERAGGIPKFVRLEAPGWTIPKRALEAAFSARTKLILFNSPMNPTAKVFTRAELDRIAALAARYDAYVVCDEVYEHLVFDGREHIPMLSLPEMRERAVRIGSAGKTFSLTGWKVGYISACPALVERIARAHQFITFTTPPNLQAAVAYGLSKERPFFANFAARMEAKRDRLAHALEAAGFAVAPCQGTYFINADITSVGFDGDDVAFCTEIIETVGVAAIPVSAFYTGEPEKRLVRFCFAKPDEMLDEAAARLRRRFGRA